MKKCSVTLVTGFLSSGKTSFINHILQGVSKEEVLIIQGERGEELIDLGKNNINLKNYLDMENLKEEELIRSLKFYAPKKVIFECNGVLESKKLIEKIRGGELKDYLRLDLIINIIDMKTFNMFLKNIPSMIIPNISLSNLIILNKCQYVKEDSLKEYRSMIEKFNQNAHIVNCIGREGKKMAFNKERLVKRMMA